MSDGLITIGKILRARGLHGELKILPLTDFPARFKELEEVVLTSPDGDNIKCSIKGVRYQEKFVLLSLKDYNSIDEVKRFNNWTVRVPKEQVRALPAGHYYWHDLIGMNVYSDSGRFIGELIDIFQTGSNDVFVVKNGKKEHLIPATAEVVKDVDIVNMRMTIHILKGLIEEDEM